MCLCEDNGTVIWWGSNENFKDDSQKETSKYPKSLFIWDCMSFKERWEVEIITSTINVNVCCEILDNPSSQPIENWFGNDNVIFPDDKAPCHITKEIKCF